MTAAWRTCSSRFVSASSIAWTWSRRGLQSDQGLQLGRARGIKVQTVRLQAVEGKHASIERIGLGNKAKIFGKVPDARSMGLVGGQAELDTNLKQSALIAAGCLADNEEGPEAQIGVAPHLRDEQLADRLGFVRDGVAFIARQDVDGKALLANVEGDDMVECIVSWVHSHDAIPCSWIVCGRARPFYRSDGRGT